MSDKNLINDDAGIGALLRRNDPAGFVSPSVCADIEARVMARVMRPSLVQRAEAFLAEILPDLRLGGVVVPWPALGAAAIACGFVLGVISYPPIQTATVVEAHTYVLTDAMAQPWEKD